MPDPTHDAAPAGAGASQGAPRDNAGIRVPPPLLYFVPWLAAYSVHLWFPMDRMPMAWRTPELALGWLLIATGVGIAASGIITFRRWRTSPVPFKPASTLVDAGPYTRTRNPMYLGLACAYVGAAFAANVLWPLVLFPFVIATVQRLVIMREEAYLERAFGDAYRAYCARVRRWI